MKKRGVNTLKTYTNYIYSWSPDNGINKDGNTKVAQFFCTAVPFSQGQDWVSTYSYNIAIVNGEQQRLAYVACDYVQ